MDNKYYVIYEAIGNFSHMVFVSDNFYRIQEYLQNRFLESDYNHDSEDDESLFYSYFAITEF